MRHKPKEIEIDYKGQVLSIYYSDTYDKPIDEIVSPLGLSYLTFPEAYTEEQYGYQGPLGKLTYNYRPVMASDGIFFLPKGCKLSLPKKPYISKQYKIAWGECLGKDVINNSIYGGSIIYHSCVVGNTLFTDFLFVRNITDSKRSLVCHTWNYDNKTFDAGYRCIRSFNKCIVVDQEKFLAKFEIDGQNWFKFIRGLYEEQNSIS